MTDQPPIGEYRPGNCSPLTIWLEPPGGPNIHVGMASSPAWADRIIRGLQLLAAAEANQPTAVAHRLSLEADQYFAGPPGRGYLSFGQAPILLQLATWEDR